jgi:hypothetical protein
MGLVFFHCSLLRSRPFFAEFVLVLVFLCENAVLADLLARARIGQGKVVAGNGLLVAVKDWPKREVVKNNWEGTVVQRQLPWPPVQTGVGARYSSDLVVQCKKSQGNLIHHFGGQCQQHIQSQMMEQYSAPCESIF